MTEIRPMQSIGTNVQDTIFQSAGGTEDLVSFLLNGNPIYHGFGPIRFARFIDSGLILPSDDNWHNPYSTTELYFSPRWERAAGHYSFTNKKFAKEMGVLEKIASETKDHETETVDVSPAAAQRATELIRSYQSSDFSSYGQSEIGFVVKLNLPSNMLNLTFGNPPNAMNHYLVMFDEDCWRLDTNHNPKICKPSLTTGEYGLNPAFVEDIYVVGRGSYQSKALSLKIGKTVSLREERISPTALGGTNLILSKPIINNQIIYNKQ